MGVILIVLLVFVGLFSLAAQQLVERFPAGESSDSVLPLFGLDGLGGPDHSVSPAGADTTTAPASGGDAEPAVEVT